MKCVVARSALNDAAKMLAAATGHSSVLPIVNYIMFDAVSSVVKRLTRR
jgi:hypothetical protein